MPAAAPCARKHATYTRALRRLVGLALARRRQPRAHAMRAVACICIHPPTMILRLGPRQRARTRARAPHAAEGANTPPPLTTFLPGGLLHARTHAVRARACVRTYRVPLVERTDNLREQPLRGGRLVRRGGLVKLFVPAEALHHHAELPARTHAGLLPRRAARDHATRAWAGVNFGEVRWEGRGVARASAGLWLREAWIANAPQGDTRCWRHRRRKGQRACSRSQESTGVNVGVDACERASERACSRLVLLSRDSFS